jgi:CubicO group peptidase (beta-lactamase class C family)
MIMRKWILGLLALLIAGAAVFWFTADKETRGLIAAMPTNRDVLFWNDEERNAAFRAMDRLPILAKANTVAAGGQPLPLPQGTTLIPDADLAAFMQDQKSAAVVIIQDGKIRNERYGLGFDAKGRWTSFSVAKSFTSTLVGAAIRDGYIRSLDDKVTEYIQDLKGSPYDDVTVAQLLTMTSGVKWNEDYSDPKSDVALFNNHKAAPGMDATVSYMRTLPREAPAGSKWVYKTGETNLIGVLVSQATGRPLSAYLSEKIWKPFGMEQQATWLLGSTGSEISGCCMQAATRDFARFGLFMLGGGVAGGKPVLPNGWIAAATSKQAETGRGEDGFDYGYQWWTLDNGAYAARGIFGQGIFIDPKRKLVIASNANWPKATDAALDAARTAFYRKVQKAVDSERGVIPM